MFKQILFVQWRSSRLVLLPLALAAFGLPVLTMQGVGSGGASLSRVPVEWLMAEMQFWLPLYPGLACVLGGSLGIAAWSWDQEQGHAYALSLPLPRWKYALLKMGAGALLLLAPVAAFWAGGVAATATAGLPAGLQAYPGAVAFRLLLASLLAYGGLFALASGTMRTTIVVLAGLVALLVGGELAADVAARFVPSLEGWSPVEWALTQLVKWPGPGEVFTGSWMLIDV